MSRREPYTQSLAAREVIGRIERRTLSDGREWLNGDVVTPQGIVSVMTDATCGTRLDFALDGRHWIRQYDRTHTKKGIVRLAAKFAREVVRGEAS